MYMHTRVLGLILRLLYLLCCPPTPSLLPHYTCFCVQPVIGDVFDVHAIYREIRQAIIEGGIGMPPACTLTHG